MEKYENNIPGMFHPDDFLVQELICSVMPKKGKMLEVGSHLGRSTLGWAERLSSKFRIFAMDFWNHDTTWRKYDHPDWKDLEGWDYMNGSPIPPDYSKSRYSRFLSNVENFPNVVPLRMTSPPEFKRGYLIEKISDLDLLFLDGDHRYDIVKKELDFYYPLMKPDAVICGHDWGREHIESRWKDNDVNRAVREFAEDKDLVILSDFFKCDVMWIATKKETADKIQTAYELCLSNG
jgi:hypothetical protein